MAEALPAFVARRRPDWTELEGLLERLRARQLALDELGTLDRLYRRAAADLAHARAFYAGTDVDRFLNQLCGRAYAAIYRQRPARWAQVRRFYAEGFPRAVRDNLRFVGLAAAVLAFGAALGGLTVGLRPEAASLFLPEALRDFIARKELWTDTALEQHAPSELATMIFTNNLQVMVMAFALGVTAGLGTLWVLFSNGLNLGATVAACVHGGLGPGILSFISAHGVVELSVICIAGGAGLMLGHALIEPGERPRAEVLRERAQVAVQLVLGCAPFLVGIGLVEGFVSPGTFFPWPVKAALGLGLGLGFWRYLLRAGRAASP